MMRQRLDRAATPGHPVTGSGPSGIFSPGKTAYVANEDSGTVTPIMTATNTTGPPIRGGPSTQAMAITPNGTTLYVVSYASGIVTPVTTATNIPGRPIPVGGNPAAIAITPAG
jgi:DNA-binding beta-propeller fold protein YncE